MMPPAPSRRRSSSAAVPPARRMPSENSLDVSNFLQRTITTLPLFRHLSEAEIATLCLAFRSAAFLCGTLVVAEGEVGEKYYVILEGRCDVVIGAVTVSSIGVGAAFGELALLREDGRRAATVVATSALRCATLDAATFKAVLLRGSAAAALGHEGGQWMGHEIMLST